jgi:LAO/AO transport system kinase
MSSLTGKGIPQLWQTILQHRAQLELSSFLALRRKRQALDWMRELIVVGLEDLFRGDRDVAARLPLLENAVQDGRTTSLVAARELLSVFMHKEKVN